MTVVPVWAISARTYSRTYLDPGVDASPRADIGPFYVVKLAGTGLEASFGILAVHASLYGVAVKAQEGCLIKCGDVERAGGRHPLAYHEFDQVEAWMHSFGDPMLDSELSVMRLTSQSTPTGFER